MARQEVRRQREGGGVTDHLEDLLTTVTRDRARACADLSEARIEMQVLELSYRPLRSARDARLPRPHARRLGRRVVERLLTAAELGEKLGMSTRWVLTEFEEGRLPGFKMNDTPRGRVRFRESEVEQWLASLRHDPKAAA
jgi:predicted DNA-binding transcriptional regulator AlpA